MSSILTYKGYKANGTYEADDDMLVGEVINARPHDTIFFGGTSIPEIHQHFHDVIDTYLEGQSDRQEERKEM